MSSSKKISSVSPTRLEETVRSLMEDGECSVTEKRGEKIYKLSITKVGKKHGKAATIDEINQAIADGLSVEGAKRVYRKEADLIDPTKDPMAEVNMLTSKLTPRVSRPHVELFNACADRFDGRGAKRLALERAIELLAEDLGLSKKDFLP